MVSLLNDPFLFNSNGDITTKEILKRFQDRQGQMQLPEAGEAYNRQDNSNRPPPKRVDADPAIWQQESSVRPMQDPAMPYGSNPGTPPKSWRGQEDSGRQSPYGQQLEPSDSNPDNPENGDGNQRREWRNSGWGRQNNNNGVGVGNT